MPNALQDAILQAIDNLAKDRINKLQTDKTVTATIVQCTNSLTGEHQVNYQGGNFVAYSEDGTSYSKNDSVYVLIPEGNFSQRKIILGNATTLDDENSMTFVGSALNDYDTIGRNIINHKNTSSFGLHSYLKEDYCLIYDYDDAVKNSGKNNKITVNIDEFQNYLKNAESIMIQAEFLTRLPLEHRNSKTGIYGLQFLLAFNDRSTNKVQYKTYSYTLDTNNMTGNPYAYNVWTEQFGIFPIDIENFSHIQSIMFFSYDFIEKNTTETAQLNKEWGADIFCNKLQIFGLKHVEDVDGDYRLKISTPDGATFKNTNSTSSLEVAATLTHQGTYLTDNTTFYWFKEDARVTASNLSEYFHTYGGAGWRRLTDKGSRETIRVYGSENKAYENKYLCVAEYKDQVILKSYFTIYNDAAKRSLNIVSDLGIKFSFDRGIPLLTCQVDGKTSNFDQGNATNRPDSYYTFVWSKIDEYKQTYTMQKTLAQLQTEYNKQVAANADYSILSNLQNQISLMQNVSFPKGINGNQLKYPIQSIDNNATFRCTLYLKDSASGEQYFAGSTDIVLQNDGAATPNDYSILIENGDQVFQYSESGVTPTSERYQDPQEVLDLYCHFFDPAGLEIDESTYSVKWQVPVPQKATLVKLPSGLSTNPANGKTDIYNNRIFKMGIVENFDYEAVENQITCIVTYKGQQYTKDTRFSFTKIGDNGTNGTDIVAKISPKSTASVLDKDMLALRISPSNVVTWNTGQTNNSQVLNFDLYQRGEQLTINSATWSILGNSSNVMTVSGNASGGTINYAVNSNLKFRNQIVKAQTTLTTNNNSTIHYAHYPIPIIKYNVSTYEIGFDTKDTLKQILYNADGRNPIYNKNQGIKFYIKNNIAATDKGIWLESIGGASSNTSTGSFKIITEKNSKNGVSSISSLGFDSNRSCMIYILPADVYSGMYTNNMIHGKIYSSKTFTTSTTPEVEFWIPIHMQLNVYGLASLNQWDGNHIEIDEDNNYILAPQIGAGKKESNNTFTGIVMGKTESYDNASGSTGLLGYSKGKQSIFLDATNGNATFGLTEKDTLDPNNPTTEGRIELRPGGTSSIARWKFNSKSLYNTSAAALGSAYSNTAAPSGSTHSIPHAYSGIMLSADPTYISVKGKRLTNSDEINFNSANAVITPGDTYEVELDPNSNSIFTIFRHTNTTNNSDFIIYTTSEGKKVVIKRGNTSVVYSRAAYKGTTYSDSQIDYWTMVTPISSTSSYFIVPHFSNGVWALRQTNKVNGETLKVGSKVYPSQMLANEGYWRREPKVGIDAQGRFYTNALRDSATALTIGNVGAFGSQALNATYLGAAFEVGGSNNLIKFFIKNDEANNAGSHLYMSSATSLSNEYQRPISMHFGTYEMYAGSGNDTFTDYQIKLDTNRVLLKAADSYFNLHKNSTNTLYINSGFTQTVKNAKNTTVGGNHSLTISGTNTISSRDKTETITGANTVNITRASTNTVGGNHSLEISGTNTLSSGNRTEDITGTSDVTITKGNTISIGGNHSLTIGGTHTLSSGSKTEDITGTNSLTITRTNTLKVTGAETETFGSTLTQSVTGNVNKTWGGTGTITITNNFNLKTGTDSTGFQVTTSNSSSAGNMRIGSRAGSIPSWPSVDSTTAISSTSSVRTSIAGSAFIDLRTGSTNPSRIISGHGLDIATNTGPIRMYSWGNATGISLLANPTSGSPNQGALLQLIPQSGGGSIFRLTSPNGSVRSMDDLSGTGYKGIQINPALSTGYAWFTGRPGSATEQSRSISATYDIYTNASLRAKNIYWNDAKTGTYNVNGNNQTYEQNNVWSHLSKIYSLFRLLRDNVIYVLEQWVDEKKFATQESLNTAVSELDKAIEAAQNAANAAQATANTALSAANAAQTTANSKVDTETYNKHKHYAAYNRLVVPNAWESRTLVVDPLTSTYLYASEITGSVNLNEYETSTAH